jgi:hypothetical protein
MNYTYIRNNIQGVYIEFSEPLDAEYWAGKIGSTYEDYQQGKWVLLSDEQVAFHESHPLASVKEVIEMQLKPLPVRTIEQARQERKQLVERYDNSEAVNSFRVVLSGGTTENPDGDDGGTVENPDGNTVSAWFTAAERSNHKNTLDAAELLGMTEIEVPLGSESVTIPLQLAKVALAKIQLYADRCYGVTQGHLANIGALTDIAAVDDYDFTAGYPEQLVFDLTKEEENDE